MLYDPESNILCIEIAGGKIEQAKEFGNFIVHISSSGKPIMVEILDASNFLGQVAKLKNLTDAGALKKIMPTT